MDFTFVNSQKTGMEEYGSIYARVRVKGLNKKYAIGFTIKQKEWEKYRSLQFVSSNIMSSIGIRYGQFANILAQIKQALESNFDPETAAATIRSIKAKNITGEEILSEKPTEKIYFADYTLQYIEELSTGQRTKRGTATKVSIGHIKNIQTLYVDIVNYQKSRRHKLTLDDITMDFQRDYIRFHQEKGTATNTISSLLSKVRMVMHAAFEAKLTSCDDFKLSSFVTRTEEVDNVFLTSEQIQEMMDLDLSSKEKIWDLIRNAKFKKKEKERLIRVYTDYKAKLLELSRDIFIVGCLTGQRYSDYSRINTNMIKTINGKKFIEIIQKKVNKRVLIPYDTRVGTILEKYNGAFPVYSYKNVIPRLKFIGELLHWTYDAKIDEARMGAKKSSRFCDMIGSHTARRSFATNAHFAGVPLASIMAVTGHGTENILRRYLKLQAEDKAIMAAADFKGLIKTK